MKIQTLVNNGTGFKPRCKLNCSMSSNSRVELADTHPVINGRSEERPITRAYFEMPFESLSLSRQLAECLVLSFPLSPMTTIPPTPPPFRWKSRITICPEKFFAVRQTGKFLHNWKGPSTIPSRALHSVSLLRSTPSYTTNC